MPSFAPGSFPHAVPGRFSSDEIAFALAWEVHAPGLTGWSVVIDTDEDGSDIILVDPPLAFDRGFIVRRVGAETVVTWAAGTLRAADLCEAMLLICPLPPDRLAAVELLAAAPA